MSEHIDLICREVIVEDYIESKGNKCDMGVLPELDKLPLFPNRGKRQSGGGTGRGEGSSYNKRRKAELENSDKVQQLFDEYLEEPEPVVNEDPLHTVLPVEIRCSILQLLSQKELLHLRKVSWTWKNTVDSIVNVNVKIDGSSKGFSGVCSLPMKCCRIKELLNPVHRHLFKRTSPEEVQIMHGICRVNFEELLLNWSHLTKLEVCWRSMMKNLLFQKGKCTSEPAVVLRRKQILPSLKILNVEVLTNDYVCDTTKRRISFNLTTLTSYEYPLLVSCGITFVGYRELHVENRYLSELLPFVSRHSGTVQLLEFTLKYATHAFYPPAHPRHILFCVPANLKCKKKTPYTAVDSQLVTTQLQKLSQSPEHHSEWEEMLKNYRKLEIAIMTRFLNWTIKHLDFFSPTIRDYGKYLRSIELMNITMYNSGAHNTVTQLDASIFQHCEQLRKLHVYRAPIIFHEEEVEPSAEIVNFYRLPKTLHEVVVDGLPVSSDEILCALHELDNLKIFYYFQSQVPRRNLLWTNGINWETLQGILEHPTLEDVKAHVTTLAQVRSRYEEPLKVLCQKYGWSSTDIKPGYMNMYQISLTKIVPR